MREYGRHIFLVVFLLNTICLFGQDSETLFFEINEKTMSEVLYELSISSGVNITFTPSQLSKKKKLSGVYYDVELTDILLDLFKDEDLGFKVVGSQIVVFRQKRQRNYFTVSGYLEDEDSKERLSNAHIMILEEGIIATTNDYGFYSISLEQGDYTLSFSYLGYESSEKKIGLDENININFTIRQNIDLPGVVIIASKHDDLNRIDRPYRDNSRTNITPNNTYPSIGGEDDLLVGLSFEPGVQNGIDGVGGLSVRGGNVDQNLLLLDGVPIYNATHALGLFSIYNSDMISDAGLIKGSFSARYGGRIASVLDVRTKDGNYKEFKLKGSISPLMFRALIEGPIVKDKVSFIVSSRRTFADLYLPKISSRIKEDQGDKGSLDYFFYDLNAKLNYRIGNNDQVFLSIYRGSDLFEDHTERTDFYLNSLNENVRLESVFDKNIGWGNNLTAIQWNHIFGPKLFSNSKITLSEYSFNSSDNSDFKYRVPNFPDVKEFFSVNFLSQIKDLSFKTDWSYAPNPKHKINFGVGRSDITFKPKRISANIESNIDSILDLENFLDEEIFDSLNEYSTEYYVYLEDQMNLSDYLTIDAGIRISNYIVNDKNYFIPQPRISVAINPINNVKLVLSYSKMAQFIHLLRSSGIGLPTDLWVPSNEEVAPQKSDQFNVGLYWTFLSDYNVGISAYESQFDNLITYQEGASFFIDDGDLIEPRLIDAADWQTKVASGEGKSHGVEFSFKKTRGIFTGALSYTNSKTSRIFEEVNNGLEYPFRYDRPHHVSSFCNYKFNKNWSMSLQFSYATGTPITLPIGRYIFDDEDQEPFQIVFTSAKNSVRLPDFHRMDLKVNYEKSWDKFKHGISLNIYNIYNKRNPFYVFLRQDFEEDTFKLRQVSLLPITPSINYRFEF